MKDFGKEEAPTGFDLKVTHIDKQTGLISKQDPYIYRVVGEPGSDQRTRLWERPAGSGNLFNKAGTAIGRWITEEKVIKGKKCKVGKYDPDAPHVMWEAPLTKDQKLARENAALKAELAAVKAEQAKKTATKKDQGA